MLVTFYQVIRSEMFQLISCVHQYDMNAILRSPEKLQRMRMMYSAVNVINYTSSLRYLSPRTIMAFFRDLNISVAVPWALV